MGFELLALYFGALPTFDACGALRQDDKALDIARGVVSAIILVLIIIAVMIGIGAVIPGQSRSYVLGGVLMLFAAGSLRALLLRMGRRSSRPIHSVLRAASVAQEEELPGSARSALTGFNVALIAGIEIAFLIATVDDGPQRAMFALAGVLAAGITGAAIPRIAIDGQRLPVGVLSTITMFLASCSQWAAASGTSPALVGAVSVAIFIGYVCISVISALVAGKDITI